MRKQKQRIFDSDQDQDFGRRNNNRNVRDDRSRSRSRSRDRSLERWRSQDEESENQQRSSGQQQEQQEQSNNASSSEKEITAQTYALELREAILQFFGQIKHQKGFVYTPQEREKMRKQQQRLFKKDRHHKKIQWTPLCEWKQEKEKQQIAILFSKEQWPIPAQKIQMLKDVFLNTSFLFGKETTPQLYHILMRIMKIKMFNQSESNSKIKQFMSSLLNQNNNQFKFFNFNFSSYHKLPENKESNQQIYHELGQKIYKQISYVISGMD